MHRNSSAMAVLGGRHMHKTYVREVYTHAYIQCEVDTERTATVKIAPEIPLMTIVTL